MGAPPSGSGALAGASGAPSHEATGSLADGTQLVLELDDAAASAPTWLLAGVTSINAAFKGGIMVPAPQVFVPMVTNGAGHISIVSSTPAGLPQGTNLFTQFWVQDAGGPKGYAASNAQHTDSVSVRGMRLVDGVWYAQIVGATTNKENAYPAPGAAVYTVLSGSFDQVP